MFRFLKSAVIAILIMSAFIFTGCEKIAASSSAAENGNDTAAYDSFFGVEVIDYKKYSSFTAKEEIQPEKFKDILRCNGWSVPYDSENYIYYIPVSQKAEWETGKLGSGAGTELYFIDNGDFTKTKTEAVSQGYKFKLFMHDGKNYIICSVVFTTIPVMAINNTNAGFDYYNPAGNDPAPGTMALYSADSVITSDITFKARGGSSKSFPKISYKMNLFKKGKPNHQNLLGMRNDDDWILLAMYTDESKIRDMLSYKLWSEFGAKNNSFGVYNGAKMQYIELILNGRYWGLYGLAVPVDKKQMDISKKKGEMICKTESWEIPTSDMLASAGSSRTVASIVMKQPKTPSQKNWDVVKDFVGLIYESPSSSFKRNIKNYVDTGNVLDYWIMVNIMSGEDNAWKNMYITFKAARSGYHAILCPWDCDLTWGVTWDEKAALFWKYDGERLSQIIGGGRLPERMLEQDIDGAKSKLVKRWAELRSDILSNKKTLELVDELTSYVKNSGAFGRDAERWPSGGHMSDDNAYIKDFIKKRMAFLDDYIKSNIG